MPQEVVIDGSGRLVIPKGVRARHRLTAGARLLLIEEGDRLVLVPRAADTSTIERAGIIVFRGALSDDIPDHCGLRDQRLCDLGRSS